MAIVAMRWGKTIYPLFILALLESSGIASLDGPTFGFLPIEQNGSLILLKAQGSHGIRCEVYHHLLSDSLDDQIRSTWEENHKPQYNLYLKRKGDYYEVGQTPDQASSSYMGISEHHDQIFISHTEGIDEISKEALIQEILRQAQDDMSHPPHDASGTDQHFIHLLNHHPLPHATGISFLSGIYANELRLTSQWNPETNKSTLSLFLDDENWTQINEWELNFPILNFSLASYSSEKSSLDLFIAGGETGLHIFTLHLEESTINPNFIERKEALDPWNSAGAYIAGVWSSETNIHFTNSHADLFSTWQQMPIEELKREASLIHADRLQKYLDSPYYVEHRNKAFKNGLLISWPFDADKLVDWIGFDLDKDLNDQMDKMGLYLSPEERANLNKRFNAWRMGGEVSGDIGMILLMAGAYKYTQYLRNARTIKQIEEINQLRTSLNIARTPAISVREGSKWLSQWKSDELYIEDTTRMANRLHQLSFGSKLLTPDKMIHLIEAVQKRKFFVRPVERVLAAMGLAEPIIQRLEYWNLQRIQKFLKLCDPKDLEKLWLAEQSAVDVYVPFVDKLNRLKQLQNLEELGPFQKIEEYQLWLGIKLDLLEALQKVRPASAIQVSAQTTQAMDWLLAQAQVSESDFPQLLAQTRVTSLILDRSEEIYRLNRILELNQAGQELSDIEKIEKMRLLIKSNWAGQGSQALNLTERSRLIARLDAIYDFENMKRSRYLNRLMQKGNFRQSALYTTYSDAANFGIEIFLRNKDGRPLFTPEVAHNVVWNSWIMVPIFLSSGLRTGKYGKAFLFLFNASNSSYMGQKLGKWGSNILNTNEMGKRWQNWDSLSPVEKMTFLIPPPNIPLTEVPGYLRRDIFEHKDQTFNSRWAIFDAAWCLILSTPRGYFVTQLSKFSGSRPQLDIDSAMYWLSREAARAAPVVANETLGAAAYTVLYPEFFDTFGLNLRILNFQLEYIDPWQTKNWEEKPKIKLSLAVNSSTKPEKVRFELTRDDRTIKFFELPETSWVETHEQIYELTWTHDIDVGERPSLFEIQNLQISNKDRWIESAWNPFVDKKFEEGKKIEISEPPYVLVQRKDPFVSGLFKALLSLSKEASTEFYKGHTHYAAGVVYMIGQYLRPFYDKDGDETKSLAKASRSNSLDVDTLKEALKITHSMNFSDYPITKDAIDHLTQDLETLAFQSIPQESLVIGDISDPKQWLNTETLKRLAQIKEDILKETRSEYVLFDEGNKVDWYTLELYKGYSYALSKLYRWYLFQFQNEIQDLESLESIETFLTLLDKMKLTGNDLTHSWTSSLYWSDQVLVDFANQFGELERLLNQTN